VNSTGDGLDESDLAWFGAAEASKLLASGDVTSVELVERLISKIERLDGGEWGLRSVLELAADAVDEAARLDTERRAGRPRGALHGVPVLVKDNIDTPAPMHTSAGSFVFGNGAPAHDAPVVSALRDAGAVILGKANLSEWANFRGRPSSSGWSAVGGQTRNPHALERSPGGSSSGSGAAVAARFAPLAVGTETDGSIICPAAACGVAGLKPTVGLVSRTGIVPISHSQDTAGPIARSADDLALLLEILARAVDDGEDEAAVSSRRPPGYETDYVGAARDGNLSGLRIGVVRDWGYVGYHPLTDAVFDSVLPAFADAGAVVVDPLDGIAERPELDERSLTVLLHEFRVGLERYLARRRQGALERGLPGADAIPRNLGDVLARMEDEPRELVGVFGTESIARAAETDGLTSPSYRTALEENRRRAGRDGLDKLFSTGGVDVLAAPAMHPAWLIDHVLGDHLTGSSWSAAAVAGYPSATLPMGAVEGLPVGVVLIGRPWTEALLLRVMGGLERVLSLAVTRPVPGFARRAGGAG